MLSVFGGQDSRPFNEQQSYVKESVKFAIKSVVQICTEWKIDLSKEVINESDNSSSQLTLEEKAFWMQVYTDYRISTSEGSFEQMEECNGGIDPSSSHRSSSIITDGGAVSISQQSNGLPPIREVVDDDEEMQATLNNMITDLTRVGKCFKSWNEVEKLVRQPREPIPTKSPLKPYKINLTLNLCLIRKK